MLFRKFAAFIAVGLLAFASLPAPADTIATTTQGKLSATTAPGQSVTTPTDGAFNTLTFNWYDANLNPTAAGTLYLLSQEYTGKAGDLSSSTNGFLAASQSINRGQYIFDPSVTLQGATSYFFYTNQNLTFSGGGNTYGGGSAYFPINNDANNQFILTPRLDINFLLTGTQAPASFNNIGAVPEPSAVVFLATGALAAAAFLHRRKLSRAA